MYFNSFVNAMMNIIYKIITIMHYSHASQYGKSLICQEILIFLKICSSV